MGRLFLVELEGNMFRCSDCDTPLAVFDHVLSRSFSCSQGRAFLFSNVVNVFMGPDEEKKMLSGMHTVQDVYCCRCCQFLGWKYNLTYAACAKITQIKAHNKNQEHKEGNYIIERWRISEEAHLCSHAGSNNGEIV